MYSVVLNGTNDKERECPSGSHRGNFLDGAIYEEFKFKNRYIHFYQFEIFAIKAAEKQRKYVIFFIITSKIFLHFLCSEVSLKRIYSVLYLMMDLL